VILARKPALYAAQALHAGLVIPDPGRLPRCAAAPVQGCELAIIGEPVNRALEVDLEKKGRSPVVGPRVR
jgi:hypothetical protein